METLADVSNELSSRYHKKKAFLKKGEKGPFYLKILKNLF